MIDGEIFCKTIQEVSFEDLPGRDPVNLDTNSIGGYLTGKVILISGAAGSISSGFLSPDCTIPPQKPYPL